MGYTFAGIKRDSSGAYYYDEDDVSKVRIPIADETERLRLNKKQLDEWFKINPNTVPELLKTMVCPLLEWGGS